MQIQKLGWILKTVCFVCLICVLQMTSSLFPNTRDKLQNGFDTLMRNLAAAGLVLDSSKTVALTTEARPPSFIQVGQPPSFIQVGDGHMIKVLRHTERFPQWNVQVTIFFDRANIKTRSQLLEVSATHGHTTEKVLGSTNFTMVPGSNISNWSPICCF